MHNLTEIIRKLESVDMTIHRLELRGLTDRRLNERAFGSVSIRQIDVSETQLLQEVRLLRLALLYEHYADLTTCIRGTVSHTRRTHHI